ncbi:nuclear transport factor 2 family protein [Denitrobaculum tricleocarpae]|uniref:Nuclear transport factor 2 family protein n=1 Tax=Denitrobaculum tricleocarpae TaxID=2591009 RepID=A0A545TRT0_9PROT|nr:nuclear transport factor 2 family protein [Denitrobaculum tricleocarpae]TQV79925.1 nuclear transport factor 2 family protein [Denitrobaculum tricleocarpae]
MAEAKDLPALARQYVELSNRHDLEAIAELFEPDAIYRSSSVGVFEGRPAILEMMRGFFAKFPDVRWEVAEYRDGEDTNVIFAFALTATEASTGDAVLRQGVETLAFSPAGLIREVDVQAAA